MEVKDKFGTVIEAGCYIVYGHALGRCAGLRIGKVLSVQPKKKSYSHENGYSITVQGIDDDWNFRGMGLTERKGTLLFGDRIIVLAPEQVPEAYRELLGE
jgi:hypothetical protein